MTVYQYIAYYYLSGNRYDAIFNYYLQNKDENKIITLFTTVLYTIKTDKIINITFYIINARRKLS